MGQYVTVPGWRRRMQAVHGLGQDDDFDFSDILGTDTASSTPDIYPVATSSPIDLTTTGVPALDSLTLPSTPSPASSSSGLQTLFGTSGGSQTMTPLQTVNWGNGVTGTYDSTTNTFYDSNGNALTGAELAQYGSFTLGAPGSASSTTAAGGLVSAIAKIFSPSPSATVPTTTGVRTVTTTSSLGSSLSSLILPIALIAGIALIVGKKR